MLCTGLNFRSLFVLLPRCLRLCLQPPDCPNFVITSFRHASPCALLLLAHLAVLAGEGLLGGNAVTVPAAVGGWPLWLSTVGRNALTLSGGASLAEVPFWMGPLLLALLAVAWLRRPAGRRWVAWPLAPACVCLLGFAVLLGQRLTYGEFFLWRYTFVLYALLLVTAAGARPWSVGGRSVSALAVAALAAAVFAPGWLGSRYQASLAVGWRFLLGPGAP